MIYDMFVLEHFTSLMKLFYANTFPAIFFNVSHIVYDVQNPQSQNMLNNKNYRSYWKSDKLKT